MLQLLSCLHISTAETHVSTTHFVTRPRCWVNWKYNCFRRYIIEGPEAEVMCESTSRWFCVQPSQRLTGTFIRSWKSSRVVIWRGLPEWRRELGWQLPQQSSTCGKLGNKTRMHEPKNIGLPPPECKQNLSQYDDWEERKRSFKSRCRMKFRERYVLAPSLISCSLNEPWLDCLFVIHRWLPCTMKS